MTVKLTKTAYVAAIAAAMLCTPVISTGIVSAQTTSTSANPVNLSSDVKIERTEKDAAGKETSVLRDPKEVVVVPGDKVVFTLNVVNSGAAPASGFRATNPIPSAVTFVAVDQDWAEVSVDGGASWGKLSALSVRSKNDGTGAEVKRAASPDDVTHIRWVFADAIAPASRSSVSYRGVVK